MRDSWARELSRVVWLVAGCILLGVIVGEIGLTLAVGAMAYIVWVLWQLKRIHDWLQTDGTVDPPETIGFWGDVCDKIYYLQKSHRSIRKKLEADVEYLRASFTSLSDAVVMLDDHGLIEWCNVSAMRMMGLRFPTDLGQPVLNFLRDPAFIAYFENKNFDDPLIVPAPHDLDKTLSIQITKFGRGNHLLFARDITEIVYLEQMRNDFVSNVSHELRTPLTVISGYIDNFAYYKDQLPALEKPLAQMSQHARRMEYLLRDLLELSRLETEANETHKSQVDLKKLVDLVVDEARASMPTGSQREINVSCGDGLILQGQQTELHSALLNLVVNACRYTREGGHIDVKCWKDEEGINFSVKDDGIGIDPLEISRLTERFYRTDKSRDVNTGGTGLGLAIVKRILQRHDAELRISSALGKGSTFTCHFPVHRAIEELVG